MKWLLPALNLTISPGEKEQHSHVLSFADGCPANPEPQFFKDAANGSPCPWEEGRVKEERQKPISFQLGF